MQVSRRDATDALYDSFYCGSRDDIITKHYHSALHICCAQYITIDIDRWISTMRCDHFHTKAINNIISVFIWWRIQLMAIVRFWNRLHSFSAPDMTRWCHRHARFNGSPYAGAKFSSDANSTNIHLIIVKSRGGTEVITAYNIYQYTKSVQR